MESSHAFEISFYEDVYQRDRNDAIVIETLANLYTKVGRIDDGLRLDRRHVRVEPLNPTAHYNLACSLALKGRHESALSSLRSALELGFSDFSWMLKDPDLKTLRRTPGFRRIIQQFSVTEK